MLVHVVDPAAYTPPYDHALCTALAAAGAEVELYTSRFAYAPPPMPQGYARRELFYRAGGAARRPQLRRAIRLAQHLPDMLRYRRAAEAAEVVHFQWLPVQYLDGRLLPARRPRARRGAHTGSARRPLVLTAHDILPREPRRGQRAAQRRLLGRFDALVVHTEHGRERLCGELAIASERVHVIPHGALEYLSRGPAEPPAFTSEVPVALFFGLLRPYKGLDVLLQAWRGIAGAQLWIVGMPRMDISALRAGAPASVRFLPRFTSDAELRGYFRRADLLVLPYREIDSSGVVFAALAFAKPLLLSDVGGFPDFEAIGAARTVAAGDVTELHVALGELLHDPAQLAKMSEGARDAAAGRYAWEGIAQRTLALYRSLL